MTENFYYLDAAKGACSKHNGKVAYFNETIFSNLLEYYFQKPTCLKNRYVLSKQNINNSNKFQLNLLIYESIRVFKKFDIKKLYQVVCMKYFKPTILVEKDTLQKTNLHKTLKLTTSPSYNNSNNNNSNQFISWLGWMLLLLAVIVAIVIAIWHILKKHRVS